VHIITKLQAGRFTVAHIAEQDDNEDDSYQSYTNVCQKRHNKRHQHQVDHWVGPGLNESPDANACKDRNQAVEHHGKVSMIPHKNINYVLNVIIELVNLLLRKHFKKLPNYT
jgi:hypothetical protein